MREYIAWTAISNDSGGHDWCRAGSVKARDARHAADKWYTRYGPNLSVRYRRAELGPPPKPAEKPWRKFKVSKASEED